MAEGAPLLRAYRRNLIEGSNPSLSAKFQTIVLYTFIVHLSKRHNVETKFRETCMASTTKRGDSWLCVVSPDCKRFNKIPHKSSRRELGCSQKRQS